MNNFNIFSIKKILTLAFLLAITVGNAQVPLSNQEIFEQLEAKGVSEEQVMQFLEANQLSVNELENLSPEEFVVLNERFDQFLVDQKNSESSSRQETTSVVRDSIKPEIKKPKPKSGKIINTEPEDESAKRFRYGDQLFSNNNLKLYSNNEVGTVPGTYVLNAGDEVQISIYGQSQLEQNFTIGDDGNIVYANGDKRLALAGLSFNEAKVKIEKVFKRIYLFRSGEITVNVTGSRTISISIYGEVKKPGGFLVSAVNSPINALVAADGITENGSYRNIKLIKDNGQSFQIDLYKFLTDPSSMPQVSLSNNDIIHVPGIEKEVLLNGAVKRPMSYELLASENVNELLKYSGGLDIDADPSSVQVARYTQSKRSLIDVPLFSGRSTFKLLNGDVIDVRRINASIENKVTVSGQVNNEGDFQLEEKMKISDLLDKLVFNAKSRTDLALLNRTEDDGKTELIKVNLDEILKNPNSDTNILLESNDALLIWSKDRFVDNNANIVINGAIRFPGQYPYDKVNTSIADIILYSGGLRRDASNVGMIFRKDPLNPNKIKYLRINPFKALESKSSVENVVLMPFDSIVILQDLSLQDSYSVEIAGQVKSPGTFQFGESMTLKDLIVLADGFTLSALTEKVEINRIIIENNKPTEVKVATVNVDADLAVSLLDGNNYQLKPFDKVFVRAVPEFEYQKVVNLEGEVKYPGKYVLENKNEKLMSVIKRAGGLTNEAFKTGAQLRRSYNDVGYIIMNLDEAEKSSRSKYNYILKAGDLIRIPKLQDIVTLKSETLYKRITTLQTEDKVDNTISIAYFPGKRADYYINEFGGGFGENSDRKEVFVQHANGEISRTIDYLLFTRYPKVKKGSLIVIPEKITVATEEKEKEKVNWTQLLNDSVAQAMSILTLLLLVERI